MDWKKFLEPLLFSSALVFVLFLSDVWEGKAPQFGPHPFLFNVILVIGSTIVLAGFEELKQGGHIKAKRNLLVCLTVSMIIPLILFFVFKHTHEKMNVGGISHLYWLLPFYVLLVAVLPVALYLNRNQAKNTSQPTTDNAS